MTSPGEIPPECPTCGKRQWPVIHSCAGGRQPRRSDPDDLSPAMRELADGLAQYLDSFMREVASDELGPLDVDYQYLANDFVDSCVVDIMRIGGGPWEVAKARACWCAHCEGVVLAHEHPNDPLARLSGRRFVVCRDCGDKRCPRAAHHDRACVNQP